MDALLFVTPDGDPGDAVLIALTELGERLGLSYNMTHSDDLPITISFDVVTPITPDRIIRAFSLGAEMLGVGLRGIELHRFDDDAEAVLWRWGRPMA